MCYRLSLTWMPHAKRWRKRYLGRTYYLKAKSNGRRDRNGYLAALSECEQLKAFIGGLLPVALAGLLFESEICGLRNPGSSRHPHLKRASLNSQTIHSGCRVDYLQRASNS